MANLSAQEIALLVEELLAAISAVGPLGVELFLKLESLLHLGPDEAANVASAIKAGLAADAETIAVVEGWKKQAGL
jgi:hypothetical protein